MKTKISMAVIGVLATASIAQAQFPLRVDIDASTIRETRNIGAGADGEVKVEQVQLDVKIHKSSSQPWKNPVFAELYVIGKPVNTDTFTVVGVTKEEFTFTTENDNTFAFKSAPYQFGETSGNINVGNEYETYLVIVIDHEGKAVETRSGRSLSEKEMTLIRTLEINKIYDENLNIVGSVDKLNKNTQKAATSATDPGDDY